MSLSHRRWLVHKAKNYFVYHFGSVLLFAVLYMFNDWVIGNNIKFGIKYLNVNLNVDKKTKEEQLQEDTKKLQEEWNNNAAFPYYLWFSLITQTTVGYGGVRGGHGQVVPHSNLTYTFQLLNVLQLASVFFIPLLSMLT